MSKTNLTPATTGNVAANKPESAKTIPPKATVSKPVATKPTVTRTAPATKKPIATKPPVTAKPVASSPVKTEPKNSAKEKSIKLVKEKPVKLKMERDSFTMPKIEYAQFGILKARLEELGQPVKKSELLRAGIMLLSAMTDTALKTTMNKVPAIKTGRPKKK
jgi:hypothetical protein